jgi:hypothetical protein
MTALKNLQKALAKATAIWQVGGLRVSETSEDNGTYWTSELGRLDEVDRIPNSEGGKVLPEKDNRLFEGKAKPCVSDLLSIHFSGTSIALMSALTYEIGKVES